MIIKLYNCLDYIKKIEKEYTDILNKVNNEFKSKGVPVSMFLAKDEKHVNGKVFIRYCGVKIKVQGEIDVENVTLPPRFMLDGFEYVIDNDTVLCSYKVFRKYANMLRPCTVVVELDKLKNIIVSKIREKAYKVKRDYITKTKIPISWVPLMQTGIIKMISKELNITYEDLIDYLVYLSDKGDINISFGESGELWLLTM